MTAAFSLADTIDGLLAEADEQDISPRAWIERHLVIRTKAGAVAPMRYNPAQERLDAAVDQLQAEGKPVRIIVLKARQQGISTWTEARCYERIRRRPWQSATIIGNELENSNHLYGMFGLFKSNDPEAPETRKSNAKTLEFKAPHGSQILVTTAAKANAGTGHTNQFLHISELAKWPNAETTMLSLLQTLPDTPDSMAIIESTAAGATGYFKTLWDDAEAGRNVWLPVFLAWHDHPEYAMPTGAYPLDRLGVDPRYNGYEGEEQTLVDKGITTDQMTWRRWAIDNKCGGDVDLFHQEYPATPREAFLYSGTPRFDMRVLDQWEQGAIDPEQRITFDPKGKYAEDPTGPIAIWRRPSANYSYVIGADCSEGNPDGDYSAASVLSRPNQDDVHAMQVATIHGHLGEIESDAYAHLLERLGYFYNTALILVEINGYGKAVAEALLKSRYPNLYFRVQRGQKEQRPTKKVGWRTGIDTKPLLESDLAALIRDDALYIPCLETVRELQGFRKLGNGRSGADPDDPHAHDDRAMALGIAVQGLGYEDASRLENLDRGRHFRKVTR